MKKLLSIIIALSLTMTLISCSSRTESNSNFDLLNYENTDINYNNADNCSFWFDNGNLYYFKEGVFNQTLICKNKQSEIKLFSSFDLRLKNGFKTGEFTSVQAYGEFVYVLYHTNGEEVFYRFDKTKNKVEEIVRANDVRQWVVKNNILIFTVVEKYIDEELESKGLYICDLNDKKESKLTSDVLDFGVVDNSIRYITYKQDDLKQSVYEYTLDDGNTNKITEINFFRGINLARFSVHRCDFDFIGDKIFCDYNDNYEITSLDISSLKIEKCSFDGVYYEINCLGDFIFADIGGDEAEVHIERQNINNGNSCITFIGEFADEVFVVNESQIIVKNDDKIYFVNVDESCYDMDSCTYVEQYRLN